MYLKVVALVLVWAGLALGSSWEFTGNFSASQISKNGWTYRDVTVSSFDIAELWLGANYYSGEVTGNRKSGSVDFVTGSAYIGIGSCPFTFLSYFEGNYSLDWHPSSGQSFAGLDVAASAGYIGTAYLLLEETAPNGTVVATLPLEWNDSIFKKGTSWSQTEVQTDSLKTLNYVTYNATNDNSNVKISFTFLVSSVAGILNQNINIAPKSLETVVAISDYPYQSSANSLTLVIGVGLGGGNVTLGGDTVYSQGSNVYFSLSDKVVVDKTETKASISGYTSANLDEEVDNSNFKSQLRGRYNSDWSFNIVKVTFPAGANNIVYDPSVGSGTSALATGSSASVLVASSIFLVAALLAMLL